MKFNLYLFLFFLLFFKNVSGSNSIIAIVGGDVLTTNQLYLTIDKNEDKLKKLAALDKLINEQIENIKIKEYDIQPTELAINDQLVRLAKKNNLTIDQIKSASNYNQVLIQINYKISKLALFEIIVNSNKNKQGTIKVQSNEEIYSNWLKNIRKNSFIVIYEEKL